MKLRHKKQSPPKEYTFSFLYRTPEQGMLNWNLIKFRVTAYSDSSAVSQSMKLLESFPQTMKVEGWGNGYYAQNACLVKGYYKDFK